MTDSRRIDKITTTNVDNRRESYSDFLINFNRHPETGGLLRSTDAEAVKRSIRNLISTDKGERLFNYDLGSDVRKTLFENMNSVTEDLMRTYIIETIDQYEPRCVVNEVLIEPDYDNGAYSITIIFTLINSPNQTVLNINLFRVR